MPRLKDITGKKFNKMTVIERAENAKQGQARWLCRCECGAERIVAGYNLTRGSVKSCGCLKKARMTKHGLSSHPMYSIWKAMKKRCNNKNDKKYLDYGGRGIIVCREWMESFESFYFDMKDSYYLGLTIDRINNDGNYEPKNCKWSTRKEQCNNKRTNCIIEYDNCKKTVSQWADEKGLSRNTLYARIFRYNWPIDKSLTTLVK